jgi:hypothetical protein
VPASPSVGSGLPSSQSSPVALASSTQGGSSAVLAASTGASTAAAIPPSYTQGGSTAIPAASSGVASAAPVASTGNGGTCTCPPPMTVTVSGDLVTVTVTVASSVPINSAGGVSSVGAASTASTDGQMGPSVSSATAYPAVTSSTMRYNFGNGTSSAFGTGTGAASATGAARHTRHRGRIGAGRKTATLGSVAPAPTD